MFGLSRRGMMRHSLLASGVLAAALLCPAASHAATVTRHNGAYCNVLLKGPIEDGDLGKLLDIYEKGSFEDLCLDSSGGSYAEAVRIAEQLVNWSYPGTVVDKGASCYGACAYVFMGGRER